jgi:hypothetical protein
VKGRTAATLAWAALAIEVALMVAAQVLDAGLTLPFELETTIPNIFFVSIVSFGALGALILTRQPTNRYGWLMSAIAFVHVVGYSAAALAGYLLYRDAAPAAGGVGAAWFFVWSATVHYVPSATLVFLLFPDGRLPSRRWRPLAVLTVISLVVASIGVATLEGPLVVFTSFTNPFGVPGPVPLALVGIGTILGAICTVGSVASLFARYRSASTIERQQLKWILYGAATSIVVTVVVLGLGVPITSAATYLSAATIVLAAAAGVAILRYHLFDIDLLINRTMVYGVTTSGIAAAFLIGIVVLQALARPFTGGSEIAVAGSTLASLGLVGPVRRWAQDGVDRRFYRARFDSARTVDDFAVRLRDQVDLDAVRGDLLATVAQTMQPAHASLWLRLPGRNDSRTPAA